MSWAAHRVSLWRPLRQRPKDWRQLWESGPSAYRGLSLKQTPKSEIFWRKMTLIFSLDRVWIIPDALETVRRRSREAPLPHALSLKMKSWSWAFSVPIVSWSLNHCFNSAPFTLRVLLSLLFFVCRSIGQSVSIKCRITDVPRWLAGVWTEQPIVTERLCLRDTLFMSRHASWM